MNHSRIIDLIAIPSAMTAFAFVAPPCHAQIPCRYDVTIISSPKCRDGDSGWVGVGAINDNGDVVGTVSCPDSQPSLPYLWNLAEGSTTLPAPGDQDLWLISLNNKRQIVGVSQFCNGCPERAFLYDNGQITVLDIPHPAYSWVSGINDSGQAVGTWYLGLVQRAALWQSGRLIDLDSILPVNSLQDHISNATAINSHGAITGIFHSSYEYNARAFILHGDRLTVLPPIPGGIDSRALSINDSGDICGYGSITPQRRFFATPRGFAWFDGEFHMIDGVSASNWTTANDLNNQRTVVGNAVVGTWTHGIVWQDGVTHDLNDLISPKGQVIVGDAISINERGEIAARGDIGLEPKGFAIGLFLRPVYAGPADLDRDCAVGLGDLSILLERWSIPPDAPGCGGAKSCPADLNGDGVVNTLDLGIMLSGWTR